MEGWGEDGNGGGANSIFASAWVLSLTMPGNVRKGACEKSFPGFSFSSF